MKGQADLWAALRLLKKNKVITSQEFKTYRGQILAGEEEGAIMGLKRKGLIKEVSIELDYQKNQL